MSATTTPLHAPAMVVLELRTIVAMPTADWIKAGYDEEKIRDMAEHLAFLRGSPTVTTDVVIYSVERRFKVTGSADGCCWSIWDGHRDDEVCTFGSDMRALAERFALKLEKEPSLVELVVE